MDQLELDSIYEGLVEYYINDYTIFETVLKRDFLEVTGVLTEEGNKNFFQKIWEGIKKVFKIIIGKIKGIGDKFKEIITKIQTSSLVKKYEKYYKNENGELDDFEYEKGFHKFLGRDINIEQCKEFLNMTSDIDIESVIFEEIEKIESAIKDKEVMRKRIQDQLIDPKESKYPFRDYQFLKENIGTILNNLIKHDARNVEKLIQKEIKECKKSYDWFEHCAKKSLEENKDYQVKSYTAYLTYLNTYKTYIAGTLTVYCSEFLKIYKSYCDLYKTAGEYLKNKKGK